ncbi:MAG: energy-coupling factor transporter transmembrane component T [Candidatus Cloacimonadota bacterium]|nr:energy-coupling factor transporter transmembrane component T [Candidatus Cloacimonadota bacterium]
MPILALKAMKINLRTLLVIIVLLTTISLTFQVLWIQLYLVLIVLGMLLLHTNRRNNFIRLFHRFKKISKLFLTLMLVQIVFRNQGDIYWQFGILKVTQHGVYYGLISSLRICLIILLAALLFERPFNDYLLAFRNWKFPYEVSFLIASVINFIPTYSQEFKNIKENLYLRGIHFGKLKLTERFKAILSIIFPVLARALLQVKERAIALELRGFRIYKKRTFIHKHKLTTLDWLLQSTAILLFIYIIGGYLI